MKKNLKFTVFLFLVGQILICGAAQISLGQNQPTQTILTLNETIDLALKQASNYRTAQINERIAQEDINQARAAFYPKLTAQPNFIYTSPSLTKTNGVREPSLLGADAITVYQGLINASGEIDTSGDTSEDVRQTTKKIVNESFVAGFRVVACGAAALAFLSALSAWLFIEGKDLKKTKSEDI